MKTKTLLKLVVVAGLTGATAFCAWKAYKIAKEYKAEQKVLDALDDAKRLSKELDKHPVEVSEEPVEPLREAPMASEGHSRAHYDIVLPKTIDPSDPPVEEEDTGVVEDPEEVGELRYDPNSEAAYNQYKQMRLADIRDRSLRKTMERLFEVSIDEVDEEDETVRQHILEARYDFFGDTSDFVDDATVAEVFLFFAEQADYDLDGGIEYWVAYIINAAKVDWGNGMEELDEFAEKLVDHTLRINGFYGIWLLKPCEMTEEKEGLMQQYWDFCKRIMAQES